MAARRGTVGSISLGGGTQPRRLHWRRWRRIVLGAPQLATSSPKQISLASKTRPILASYCSAVCDRDAGQGIFPWLAGHRSLRLRPSRWAELAMSRECKYRSELDMPTHGLDLRPIVPALSIGEPIAMSAMRLLRYSRHVPAAGKFCGWPLTLGPINFPI